VKLVRSVPLVWDAVFTGAWFVGFLTAAAVYMLLNPFGEK
jgi:hypothetical protein